MEPRRLTLILTALALSSVTGSACGTPADQQGGAVLATTPGGAEEPSRGDPIAETREKAQPKPAGEHPQRSPQPGGDAPRPAASPPRLTYGANADFYYTANLNHPFNAKNALRYPEINDEHGPHLGSANLWVQRERTPIGFRVDLGYGTSVLLGHSREPSHSNFLHHVEQAYVSANLNKSGSTYIDVGQWNSPAGVLSGHQPNWLYTNDWFFCFVVPVYHLGARVYHYFNDADYVMAGVHRGWDAAGDPHHGPGMILSGGEKLNSQWRLFGTYIGGDERNGAGGSSWRHLVNLMALWDRSPRWAHSFEADYGQQGNVAVASRSPRTIQWYGAAAAAKHALGAKQYVAARAQWYREDSGLLIGFRGSMTSLAANYTRIVSDHLQLRYEYRHDFAAGGKPFADRPRGTFTGQQGTFVISAVVIL